MRYPDHRILSADAVQLTRTFVQAPSSAATKWRNRQENKKLFCHSGVDPGASVVVLKKYPLLKNAICPLVRNLGLPLTQADVSTD